MNPDLQAERNKASFDPTKITNLLDGGADQTARRRALEKLIETDPSGVFNNDKNHYMHRNERHVRALAKFVRLVELMRIVSPENCTDLDVAANDDFRFLIGAVADDLPAALHWIMFVPNIKSLCDEEQQAFWMPLIRDWKVIGCYAQTELGHGSNVRGLETTATFVKDCEDGSFVINSPTLTSAKFWPGTLGRTANHAVVIARLIDGDGVDRGIHNFLVQLRSFDDHTPMPGVKTGDIGPKIGYNNMDNGFARFDHVKIPRRNMAMRFAVVDKYGKYTKKTMSEAASKVAYITMMQVRAYIVNEAGKALAAGCTITTRYSVVRRQGFDLSKGGEKTKAEVQILDYKQQQHRILPLVASAYCFFFTGRKVLHDLQAIERNLVAGVGEMVTKTEVADLHASSSCLKSFCSGVTADGIEDLRKACGGHGFLQASGLPELLGTYLQNPTVEGDNYMLPQQTVRVLLKIPQAVMSGDEEMMKAYEKCDSYYLVQKISKIMEGGDSQCSAIEKDTFLDLNVLLEAFKHRTARMLIATAECMQENISEKGMSQQEAWNEGLVQFARVSRAHAMYLVLHNVCVFLNEEAHLTLGSAEVAVLKDLAILFALWWMEKDLGDFLEDGYLSGEQSSWVRKLVLTMMSKIRPEAVALVDAWDYSDFRLKSALGRFDGIVYPAIMESTSKDPLNATEPGPGYEHLKRLIVDDVGVSGTASRL